MRTTRLVHSLQLALALAAFAKSAAAQGGGALDLPMLLRGGGGGGVGAVKPTLDAGHSVHQSISAQGGTLQLIAKGTTFILVVPANALQTAQDISLTAIKSIKGLPFTPGLVAGVLIGPPGLRFDALASLAILPPQPVPLEQETTFGYRGAGGPLFLFPASLDNRPVVLAVMHTGGFGLARGAAREQAAQLNRRPVNLEDQYDQQLWQYHWQQRQQLLASFTAVENELTIDLQRDAGWYQDYFDSKMGSTLDAMQQNCAQRLKYGPRAKKYLADAARDGVADQLGDEASLIHHALASGDARCLDEAAAKCNQGDATKVVVALGWWQQILADGGAPVNTGPLQSCLTFELEWKPTVEARSNVDPLIDSKHELDTLAVIRFTVTPGVMPRGESDPVANNYVSATWIGKPDKCTVTDTPAAPGSFQVRTMTLKTNFFEGVRPPAPTIDMVYSTGDPQTATATACPGSPVANKTMSLFTPAYEVLHISEVPQPFEFNVYAPPSSRWTVTQAPTYAGILYEDNAVGGLAKETTRLVLFHKPGQ